MHSALHLLVHQTLNLLYTRPCDNFGAVTGSGTGSTLGLYSPVAPRWKEVRRLHSTNASLEVSTRDQMLQGMTSGPGEVAPALPRMWDSSPIVRTPIQLLRTSHHLSCPETDRAGENSHVKIQDLGGKTCLLWQTFFVQRDFWTEGSCHVSLLKIFCFNDTAQSKKKRISECFLLV